MNLVAEEYCACNVNEDGVLIMSECAGAAEQLHPEAVLVNPHDVEEVAGSIAAACTINEAAQPLYDLLPCYRRVPAGGGLS
jgi:trehalose-6-phosphate synthase